MSRKQLIRYYVILFLFAIWVIWFCASCNSVKKVLSDPAKLERVGREWEKSHPCYPSVIQGKDSIKIDTVYNNDFVFGEDTVRVDSFETTVTRTIIKKVPVYITKTVLRVDTVSDTRRENLLKQDIANREGQIKILTENVKTEKVKKNKWMWWLIGSNAFWLLIGFMVVKSSIKSNAIK